MSPPRPSASSPFFTCVLPTFLVLFFFERFSFSKGEGDHASPSIPPTHFQELFGLPFLMLGRLNVGTSGYAEGFSPHGSRWGITGSVFPQLSPQDSPLLRTCFHRMEPLWQGGTFPPTRRFLMIFFRLTSIRSSKVFWAEDPPPYRRQSFPKNVREIAFFSLPCLRLLRSIRRPNFDS